MSWLPSMKGAGWAAAILATIALAAAFIIGTCVGGCATPAPRPLATSSSGLAASTPAPAGHIPDALPAELTVGLGDTEVGATWMKNSGARWWARYRYLVTQPDGHGWADNWGYGTRTGNFAAKYLAESGAAGFVPVVTWYELLGVTTGGEDQTYAKVKSPAAMKTYFSDFKLLMQVEKAYASPSLVHLEPDGYAQLQIQCGGNPSAPAAVASTGLPELAGLPNTVAGWGQAFGAIRAAVGASNVLLAPHYSTWSTGVDLMRGSGLTADIATHVDRTATFLNALGTYDLVAVEWLDRDSQTRGIWWDQRDDAGTNTASFNRDLAIFRRLNQATGKRLLLWQVPHGTSWSAIKSGHAEYVFGPGGATHREAMGSAGVVSVLFGAGATGQTTHLTGYGPDAGLYLRGEVAAFQRSEAPVCVPPPPPPPICTGGRDGGLGLPR